MKQNKKLRTGNTGLLAALEKSIGKAVADMETPLTGIIRTKGPEITARIAVELEDNSLTP